MAKIILCRGIQGSGKTTWAKQWVLEDPENRVRFNNDDIRNMLGNYWVPSREKLVNSIKHCTLMSAMLENYDIVVDNMNLNSKESLYFDTLITAWNKVQSNKYEIEFKDFFIPLQDCIDRDAKRPNPIGEYVIRKTYEKYKNIIEST